MLKRLVVAPIHYFYSNFRDPLPEEILLEDGYILKKFDASILTPVFEFFGRYHSEEDKEELKKCRYAIYYEYETENETSNTPEKILENIHRIIFALRIVKRTRAVVTVIHLRVTESQPIAIDALQVHPKPPTAISYIDHDEDMEHFVSADAASIQRYFSIIKGLYQAHGGTYHKVLNSLIFFELAHYQHQYQVRFILFVTCLESLFNTSTEQIGYMLRVRCSYFLERDPNRRVALARLIKKIYNLRSKLVHGQGTPPPILRDAEAQKQLMMEVENINRRCIKKIFDNNLISIFDHANSLSDEFDKLELGVTSALE